MLNRRLCLAGITGASLSVMAGMARAAGPLVIYADGISPGWSIGGWAQNTPQVPMEDQKPVQITMPGWSVFTFQTATPVDTSAYKTLTVILHGGDAGKQEFALVAKQGEKVVSKEANLKCQKGKWGRTDIPLDWMKITAPIDSLVLQNKAGEAMAPFYLNYVLFQ